MTRTDVNRPLRVFDKVLRGGLGAGNLGVVMSRHGTGKQAVMTAIAIDHAMKGVDTLHVVYGKAVHDVRAYDDQVLRQMIECYGIEDSIAVATTVERHKQIYTYRQGELTRERFKNTLKFLAEHAEFRPEIIEIQGWPDFAKVTEDEIRALKQIATEHGAGIWLSAHTHREDVLDERGVPDYIARLDDYLSVLVSLDPVGDHVHLRFHKTHDFPPPEGLHLEFDPNTLLVRWR